MGNTTYNKGSPVAKRKGRYLTQSLDKGPIPFKNKNANEQNKEATKTFIKQWLQTDSKRSVGVTTAIQMMWLNGFMTFQPSHQSQKLCNQKKKHFFLKC